MPLTIEPGNQGHRISKDWPESVGDTDIESVTSSVPGKEGTQVMAVGSQLISGFIIQQLPARLTKTTAPGAPVAHDRGLLSMARADGYHNRQPTAGANDGFPWGKDATGR
jgi:hypothetical protein